MSIKHDTVPKLEKFVDVRERPNKKPLNSQQGFAIETSTRSMHDAMQVVFGHIFSGKPWPVPLACVPWKVKDGHHTLTLKPYRDLVKAALVCKGAHMLFKKFIEAKIWDDEDPYFIFADAFAQAVDRFCFHTWKGKLQATLTATHFSVLVHNAFFFGATITCRAMAPGVHEIVAHYGVADAGPASAALVTTVPAGEYVPFFDRKRNTQEKMETILWKQWQGNTLLAFLKAEHSKALV